MNVAIVYETLFGNTRTIAEAVAEGATEGVPAVLVTVVPVADATPDTVQGADLLVVGGPTHMRRMPTAQSRQKTLEAAAKAPRASAASLQSTPGTAGPGLKEWLDQLPDALPGRRAAAFDTRYAFPLAGGAANRIGRVLRRRGYRIEPQGGQGFVVKGYQGPLAAGERERARAWGATLVH